MHGSKWRESERHATLPGALDGACCLRRPRKRRRLGRIDADPEKDGDARCGAKCNPLGWLFFHQQSVTRVEFIDPVGMSCRHLCQSDCNGCGGATPCREGAFKCAPGQLRGESAAPGHDIKVGDRPANKRCLACHISRKFGRHGRGRQVDAFAARDCKRHMSVEHRQFAIDAREYRERPALANLGNADPPAEIVEARAWRRHRDRRCRAAAIFPRRGDTFAGA